MLASLGAAIALSTVLKYKVTIQAPATVRPMGELRLVQSTIEGSVMSISVRENQTVKKGDRIATVPDLRLESKLQTRRRTLVGDIQKAKSQILAVDAQIGASDRQGIAEIAHLQQERQKLLQQRLEILNQIATSDREIVQIATELQPTAILAPVSGTVEGLNLRNNNQVVHPGDRLAQIVPTGIPLHIKAYVAISDVSNVKVGQKVQMRISACPYTDYGVGSGIVRAISADAKPMQRNVGNTPQQLQAVANDIYEVTVEPDNLNLSRGSSKCQIRSGMNGRADIISKEETVLQFILRKSRLLG